MRGVRNHKPREATEADINAAGGAALADIDAIVRVCGGLKVTIDNVDFTREFAAGAADRLREYVRGRERMLFRTMEAMRAPRSKKHVVA